MVPNRLLIIVVCLVACTVIIAVLRLFETTLGCRTQNAAASAPPSGPAHARSSWRNLWLKWIPIIFVTAFVGLGAIRFAKMQVDIRSALRNLGSQVSDTQPSESQIFVQDVEQLANQILKRDDANLELIPVTVPRETTENLPPAEPALQSVETTEQQKENDTLAVTIFAPFATEGTQVAELPEWTSQTGESEGLPHVVRSGPNPTPVGAMAEAFTRLVTLLSKELAREHPEAAGWVPQFSDLYRIGVIGRRAVERSEVTVGQFTEPVFQEFIEVIRPENLDAQLVQLWRADTVKSRLLMVGGGMGLITFLFASLAGYFRIDEATRGKYRRQLRAGVAAAWIGAAGLAGMIVG